MVCPKVSISNSLTRWPKRTFFPTLQRGYGVKRQRGSSSSRFDGEIFRSEKTFIEPLLKVLSQAPAGWVLRVDEK